MPSAQAAPEAQVKLHSAIGTLCRHRVYISTLCALLAGGTYYYGHPFSSSNPLLLLLAHAAAPCLTALYGTYLYIVFGAPFILSIFLLSQLYVRVYEGNDPVMYHPLPPYPDPRTRDTLFLVAGETHNRTNLERAVTPTWCLIPERGLYTGVLILGAIGGGKTSSAMTPYIDQLAAYRCDDPRRKLSGLVLEVKGDFCFTVRDILTKYGRADDYLEISLDGDYRYNPLFNDQSAYAKAYQIASVMKQLYGAGNDPFWTIQGTTVIKYMIMLHELADGYVTMIDVLRVACNEEALDQKLRETRARFGYRQYFLIDLDARSTHHEQWAAANIQWEAVDGEGYRAPASEALATLMRRLGVEIWPVSYRATSQQDQDRFAMLEEIERWAKEWRAYDKKLRSSIVAGISGTLSLFADNPKVARVFCPPKSVYDFPPGHPKHNPALGRPMPKFTDTIEQGVVCALNFPTSVDPGLAKLVGTMMKNDFQNAMINRIAKMKGREDEFRPVFFAVDEYQYFCTLGLDDPNGDEKFLSLSRQPKCIPILATQSITSLKTATRDPDGYKTLLQVLRTRIGFSTADSETARFMADMVGKEQKLRVNWNISESAQDASVSQLTGKTVSDKSSISQSVSYSHQIDYIFHPHEFQNLPNAATISLIYDGHEAHSQVLFTCPYYLSRDITWHEKRAQGLL